VETSLQDRIRERAYEIWNAGGRTHGRAEQHWLAAEREILAQVTSENPSSNQLKTTKVMRQRRPITNMQPHKKAAKAG
jgi:hypothetical protein